MTPDEMNKLGKDSMETAMNSFGAWSKSGQAIVTEMVDYSKKSVEGSAAHWEKLLGVKSLEKAMEVQTEYLKSSYERLSPRRPSSASFTSISPRKPISRSKAPSRK